ncbi:hypothetical protein V2J09_004143 [Rumex salicifolius]
MLTPHESLYKTPPTYTHLRTFGCLCYPNLTATTKHKLEPRSTPCIFLGYATSHKGYRCLALDTHKVIISRNVIFDEFQFPYKLSNSAQDTDLDQFTEEPQISQSLPLIRPDPTNVPINRNSQNSKTKSIPTPLLPLLTASSPAFLRSIINALSTEFSMSDLGPLHHFLGIAVTRTSSGMLLSQEQYARELLIRSKMVDCNPCRTPVDTGSKLSHDSGPAVSDPTAFRSLAGALQYLTFTRPDISYAVQQCCLFMHDPREKHMRQKTVKAWGGEARRWLNGGETRRLRKNKNIQS